ncbi:MAG TPA: TonB family protein [Blastocatellia bacterium]|nr:TonB family protein [Blastocatellia bacterium]
MNARVAVLIAAAFASWVAAAPALAQEGSKPQAAPPRLISDLKSKKADTRRAAATQLGQIRARESVRPLIAALADADVTVREAAAFALGQIADATASLPLTRALADKDTEVRASAAFALGMIGERKSLQALSDALADEEPAVRAAAATALGLMQDPQAVDELVAMLNDPSFDVRYDAVWALGYIGEPDAVEPLNTALLNLSSLQVSDTLREAFRQNAQNALESLRTTEYVERTRQRIVEPPDRPNEPKTYSMAITPATIQESVQPAPTERADRAKVQGAVTLKVLVGADGRAVRAYVTRRLGHGLDHRAAEAILQYRFIPAKQGGLPQTTWMNIDVKF